MKTCFFCGEPILFNEQYFVVRWHAARFKKWEEIGAACEGCGEVTCCNIESKNKPVENKGAQS